MRVLLLSRTEVADSEAFPKVPFGSLWFGTALAKNQAKLFDGAVLGDAKQGKGGSWMRIFERLKEVLNSLCGGVCRQQLRHWNGGGKEFDRVVVTFASCLWDEYSPAAVMVRSGTNVPAVNAMGCPGSTD
jgi:nicotinamide mononucleotide (NMN) deamidase PncC